MKYNILIILIVSFLSSCKKDYHCSCQVRNTIQSQVSNPSYGTTETVEITYKGVTKRVAKKNCLDLAVKYSNMQNYIVQDCTLK
jgi:hypothetical protein